MSSSNARSTSDSSAISPFRKVYLSWPSNSLRFSRFPAYVSLSTFKMRCGEEESIWRMKLLPMKPHPPVTRITWLLLSIFSHPLVRNVVVMGIQAVLVRAFGTVCFRRRVDDDRLFLGDALPSVIDLAGHLDE